MDQDQGVSAPTQANAVVGSFNFSAQLPNGKSLTFSGYVLAGESMDEIDRKLDIAAKAVDRQRMIAEIPELEMKLQQLQEGRQQSMDIIASATSELGKLDNKGPGYRNKAAQHELQINNHRVTIAKYDREIARGSEVLANARAMAQAALAAVAENDRVEA
jgi:hypothetical protein